MFFKWSKLFFIFILTVSTGAYAQSGTWVWVKGGDSIGAIPVYGVQGVPDINNAPGGLWEAVTWIDKKGDFWFFGGFRDSLQKGYWPLADMWRYQPASNAWTWMNGPGKICSHTVYGKKGIPSSANHPYSGWNYIHWTDGNGDLWLYNIALDSNAAPTLWRYNTSINQWTWVNGSSASYQTGPVYGSYRVPDTANTPGFRSASAYWVDKDNNLCLFGGSGGPPDSIYADIWQYNIATTTWTWMGGRKGLVSKMAYNYGQMGIESASNLPPTTGGFCCWTNEDGYVYLFGGLSARGYNNAVWRYNPATDRWAWIAGDSSANSSGYYGNYCDDSGVDCPSARVTMPAATFNDALSFTYMFGGWNLGIDDVGQNDLWAFYPATETWQWLNGNVQFHSTSNYGTMSVAAAVNQITPRQGQCEWIDGDGVLWVYGGLSWDTTNAPGGGVHGGKHPLPCCILPTKNDLWKYIPDTSCLHFSLSPNIYIPNAFSPNGDGINDHFVVFATNILQYELKIFNRWGEIVYSSTDLAALNDTTRGWDGTFKGKIQDPGIFIYTFTGKGTNGQPFNKKGDITLIR